MSNFLLPRRLVKDKYILTLILFGVFFLVIYSWLFIKIGIKFTSPDETVNYYFSRLFAETGRLHIAEPLNQFANGLITPRNAASVGGKIVPSSFLGIILIYGTLAKVFGTQIILYLTPLFSVAAVLFFYSLIKEIFSRPVAFISSLLMFISPPFWYYSSRGMFHNALFLDLLIIGLFFLIKYVKQPPPLKYSFVYFALAGIFLGLSLITRTSEIVWVSLCVSIILLLSNIPHKIRHIIFLFLIILIFFLPIFYFNNQLFGSPFSFGYALDSSGTNHVSPASISFLNKIIRFILPFGWNIKRTAGAVYQYIVVIFPWFSILLFIGIVWFLKNVILSRISAVFPSIGKYNRELPAYQKLYFSLFLFIFFWLIFYYGPYVFFEYYDRSEIILGSSYLRYWMPIFVFSLPILVIIILKIGNFFSDLRLKKAVVLLFIFTIFTLSVNKVLFDPLQGLYQIKKHIGASVSKARVILEKTEKNSIIVSGFADKIIFPERKVIVSLPNDKNVRDKLVKTLLDKTKIYYFYNPLDNQARQVIESMKRSGYKFKTIYYFVKDDEILYELSLD